MTEAQAIQIIWNYMLMGHELRPADCLLVLCSYDTRVAERAAELFGMGMAPYVVISGGGHAAGLTGTWGKPEAEVFAEVMRERGVPGDKIFLEMKSENTGENAAYTQELLEAHGLDPRTLIVVQKPYMERRSYATLKKWWPDRELLLASPQAGFEEWVARSGIPRKRIIDAMVGDLHRIKTYPERGFQISQEIPAEVWVAYEFMVEQGYGRVVRDGPETRPLEK